MSLSGTQNGDSLQREVISPLSANDAGGAVVTIQPGSRVSSYRIIANPRPGEAYSMEFESGGQRYRCPLTRFQPRTAAVEPDKMEMCAPAKSSNASTSIL